MSDTQLVYSSKIDAWLGVLIGGTFALGLYLVARAVVAGALIVAALVVLVLGFVTAVMFPTRYTITSAELVIQGGLLRTRIPLERIRRIYPHRTLIASPAMSLDRLAIEYQVSRSSRPTVWISPREKERFLQELARTAGLVRRGAELVRLEADGDTEPGESNGDAAETSG